MKRGATIFLLCTAAMWSFSVSIWYATGFGYVREASYEIVYLFLGALVATPLWLPALFVGSCSTLAKIIRFLSFAVLVAFFALAGKFVAETVLFPRLGTEKPVGVLLANIFLFRLPFILAFIATLLLGTLVWKDFSWRHRPPGAT